MKKFLSFAGVLLCAYQLHRVSADWGRFAQWNQERQEAEQLLVCETRAYQACPSCASNRCPGVAFWRQQRLIRLGAARANAIRILQQKPGALTATEARRLNDYSALFGRLEQGLVIPSEGP